MNGKDTQVEARYFKAKPLSGLLGSISSAHLKNSTDLIARLKTMDLKGKKLASYHVKSLFTNVPVDGTMKAVRRALNSVIDDALPLDKSDYVRLVSLCVNFGPFEFEGEEYVTHCAWFSNGIAT